MGIAGPVVEVVETSIPDLLGILVLICHFGQNGGRQDRRASQTERMVMLRPFQLCRGGST